MRISSGGRGRVLGIGRRLHMIKAVLFDLDDTLLSLNLTAFLAAYVNGASGLLLRRMILMI